jgi:hypothetical protein
MALRNLRAIKAVLSLRVYRSRYYLMSSATSISFTLKLNEIIP